MNDSLKDAKLNVKDMEYEERKMPPMPAELFEWSEKDKEFLHYKGNIDNYLNRLKFTLYGCWLLWVDLVQNDKFTELVSEKVKEGSDEFYIRSVFVNMIDRLGKILSNTDILTEMAYTIENEKKSELNNIDAQNENEDE